MLRNVLTIVGAAIIVVALVMAGRLLLLRQDIGRYRAYWDGRAAEEIPSAGLVYVALGDSAAQGIGASTPLKGYVGQIAERLESRYGKPVHIINLSVTGARVQDAIEEQIPKLNRLRVSEETIVTLDIGANNLRTYEQGTFMAQIDTLFSQLPKQTIVAEIPYFGGGSARKLEGRALEATEVIKEIAAKYDLRVAPLHETTKAGDGWANYAADFFHPSDRGYENWFQAYWEILAP